MFAAITEGRNMLHIGVSIVCLAGIGYILYTFISSYLSVSGSRWDRVLMAFKSSLTIMWARFVVVVGLVTALLVNVADYFNMPGVAEALQNYMTPTTVSMIGVGVMIISEIARRRTLD